MTRHWGKYLLQLALLGALVLPAPNGDAQNGKQATKPTPAATTDEDASGSVAPTLTPQDKEVAAWLTAFQKEAVKTMEGWISKDVSEEKLFSQLYYPMPDTSPVKFTTDYDKFADRDFPGVQEKYAAKASWILYAVVTDRNGYLPTHNQRYTKPLTGNLAFDLANNRTKRIFGDQTGFAAARNRTPRLVQQYERDNGDVIVDLSAPLVIKGKHWGCVRMGYQRVAQ